MIDFGYRIVQTKYLRPRLERERSRDGSCFNLSAAARNKAKLDDASKLWVDHRERVIYGPPHVIEKLMAHLPRGEHA